MTDTSLFSALSFALGITVPNLALMALGFYLQRTGEINTTFVNIGSKVVFSYCLPCLLFFSVLKSNVDYAQQVPLLMAGVVATFILFFGAELYARFFIERAEDKGVFVQGVFRSNMAIISLALVANAYGAEGLSVGAVYMGVITILFNVLAVITLSRTQTQEISFAQRAQDIVKKIITNPLIIALVGAFAYKAVGLPMPSAPIQKTGSLLAGVALPLALICAGASLDLKTMFGLSGLSMQASLARILIAPMVAIGVGFAFQLPPLHMGVLFLMVSAPVAAASYVMAKAMGGNETLAANILGFTTVFSMVGIAIGVTILRTLGWM